MLPLKFIWDPRKAHSNIRKHDVSFEEASTVFFDENAIIYFDPDHSVEEDRFLMLGLSRNLKMLVVSYCYRRDGSLIRLIMARKATKYESTAYEKGNRI